MFLLIFFPGENRVMNSDTEGSRDVNLDITENKIVDDLEATGDSDQAIDTDFDTPESQAAWNNFLLQSG